MITAILHPFVRLPDPPMILRKFLLITSYLFPIIRIELICVQYPVLIAPNHVRVIIDFFITSSLILTYVYLPIFLILPLRGIWIVNHL
jgi:hypothetical protein